MFKRLLFILLIPIQFADAQPLHGARHFTRADTLRGSIGPERAWFDVTHYDVNVRPDYDTRSILGRTTISFVAVDSGRMMQVDLQEPMIVDSVSTDVSEYRDHAFTIAEKRIASIREGNIVHIELPATLKKGEASTITIRYHGIPRAAKMPPWDGGWIWKTDDAGNPWMSVACQGLGASVWYPCKDHQSDEPDDGAVLHITVPDTLQAIGNGRLRDTIRNMDGTTTWTWVVTHPINTYNLVPYIGRYAHLGEVYAGAKGPLDCDYWVLTAHASKAREQFEQVPSMLNCFEANFGPYPFYEDSYKLVEAPHLGMEHQSAVAYGNGFQNGYLGVDLSASGWGLKWDYIIIHESGHEWFGNSITTADIADMWVHEGFTDYAETIYTQCLFGEEAGNDYVVGLRKKVANDKPIIGPYGVNQEGSVDMYYKGANMLHTIRHIIGDSTFKAMLLEMNRRFFHRVTSSAEVETFINTFAKRDLSKVFDQYLRTTKVPVLEWTVRKGNLFVRWANCVDGLSMPVSILVNGEDRMIQVGTQWSWPAHGMKKVQLTVDRNWYVTSHYAGKHAITKQEVGDLRSKVKAWVPSF